MVGYDPDKINLSAREQAIIGASTAVLSRFFIQPLDVIKIRFQVQVEPISKKSEISKYRGIRQSVSTIFREEGLVALWKGHLTGQILSASYVTTQFVWFETITRLSYNIWPHLYQTDNKKFLSHFLSGGLAASLTILSCQPIDVIRTRLVAQGEPKAYNGIMDAFRKIYIREGFRGFYKGTVPALMLTTPETAFRFGIYQLLNSNWEKINKYLKSLISNRIDHPLIETEIGFLQSTINGSLSGVTAKTIVYPFDLAKKRLQIQGFESAREQFGKVLKFNGLFNCFYVTIKREGFFGIYKGYLPSMLKSAVSSGLVFLIYEQLTNFVRRVRKKQSN